MMDQIEVAQCWRRMMLNDDGTVKPDAEIVLRDLERMCGWMVSALPVDDGGRVDPYRTAAALEKRGVYAMVKRRLFEDLTRLKRKQEKTNV